MNPKFSTLIILTLVTALILTPFVVSPIYLPMIRDRVFDTYLFLQDNLYKQITGYVALAFVLLEMILTLRKRGRSLPIKITIPASVKLWRTLHIFLGVTLVGAVLVHTIGDMGLNFNTIFLWVFFGVSLSALMGVVAETGILESNQRVFFPRLVNQTAAGKKVAGVSKGSLIRSLRSVWLTTHIILVSIFFVMLVVHIFLAYYFQ